MLIKSLFPGYVLVCLTAVGLVACANPGGGEGHTRHHAERSANTGMMSGAMMGSHGGTGMMGAGTAGGKGGMQHMDKDSMCAMHGRMRDAPNEQARQAMMDRQMQGMSPEMRQQHMEMMRQQCQ